MKRNFLMAPVFAVFLFLGSCTSTSVIGEDPNPSPEQTGGKLHIQLSTNSYTRADVDEEVRSLHIAFYKGDICLGVTEAVTYGSKEYTVDVPVTPGSRPDRVVAFANLEVGDLAKINCSFTELNGITIENVQNNDKGFVMTSSRYFNDEGIDMLATPISEDNYEKGTPIDIALERVAAKVGLTNKTNAESLTVDMKQAATNNTRKLVLALDGWGLSAVEKSSFLVKQMTYPASALWQNWNENKVCHWAHSVSWNEAISFPKAGETAPVGGYALNYPAFSELSNEMGIVVYENEITRPAKDYTEHNAVASVVIKGHYTFDGVSTQQTFYKYGEGIYTEEELWEMLSQQQDVAFMNDGKNKESAANFKEDARLVNIDGMPSNLFTIQFDEDSELDRYYDRNSKSLDSYELTELNKKLIESVGYVEKFENGKCTFIVPIQHQNYKNDVAEQAEGAYGLVRNHYYNLTLNSIEGIGSGVASDNDIVISSDYQSSIPQYKVNVIVSVNPWTTLDQDINIKK